VLDKLTKESFVPATGSVFALPLGDGTTVRLELFEVLGNGLQGRARREQFALHFRGPASPALVQRTYQLEHQSLGTLEIFLVPVEKNADGMIYEAVFT
jgi:hypothetical protein